MFTKVFVLWMTLKLSHMEKDFTIIRFPYSRIACQISLGTINHMAILKEIYIVVHLLVHFLSSGGVARND